MHIKIPLTRLCEKIAYQFKDMRYLDQSLHHRSVVGLNNERLEFLGDSLLNMIIAEALYHQFPQADEGTLSRLRAYLVREKTLAQIAEQLTVPLYLRLGPGELKAGGQRRDSIRADALEAMIAAIYLDAGFLTCQRVVLTWFSGWLQGLSLDMSLKDPKTVLQEKLQAKQWALPEYTVISISGKAHEQNFEVSCKIAQINDQLFIGRGNSRRKAEQAAAEQALIFFNDGMKKL